MINNNFQCHGKKNNQTSVSEVDLEIPTVESTDNAGNSVNLVSGIIHLPSGSDFSVCIGDRCYILFITSFHGSRTAVRPRIVLVIQFL